MLFCRNTLFVLFFSLPFFVQAQISKVDSLENLIKTGKDDTSKIYIYSQLYLECWRFKPEKVKEYAEQSLKLSEKLKFIKGIAKSYSGFGIYYWSQSAYDTAIEYHTKALGLFEKIKYPLGVAKSFSNIGMCFKLKGNYALAHEYYIKALKIGESTGDKYTEANLLNDLGILYKDQEKYDIALGYYKRSLNIFKSIDRKSDIAGALANIAQVYSKKGDTTNALTHLKQSLEMFESLQDPKGKALCYNQIGSIYTDQKKFEEGRALLEKGRAISEQYKFMTSLLSSLIGLGENYLLTGKPEEARSYFIQARDLSQKAGLRLHIKNAYKGLAKSDFAIGNYKEAYEYQAKYLDLKDSIFNEESTKKITMIQSLFESEKKQAEIEILKKDSQLNMLYKNIIAGGLALTIIIAFLVVSKQKLRLRKNNEIISKNQLIHVTEQQLMQVQIDNSQLKEKKLEMELEFRNKELTTYTLNIIQKSEVLEELKEGIYELINTSTHDAPVKLNRLVKLIEYGHSLDKDWEGFKMYFEQVHQDFFVKLKDKFPEISSSELKLCSLIKLNLSMKESATVLGISPESVKTARHRLRKKLNLPTEQNLVDFLFMV